MPDLAARRKQIWQETEKRGVTLCAVTKGRSLSDFQSLLRDLPGLRAVGENRWPDCVEKFEYLYREHPEIERHFIGPLQSNKVRKVVPLVDVIQSVDNLKILHKIDAAAAEFQRMIKFYVQVNVSGNPDQHGVAPEDLTDLIEEYEAAGLKHVELTGLMAIARQGNEAAVDFDQMNKIFEQFSLDTLSIGMSGDYKEAISAGSTMVRIGSLLF